MSDIDMLYRELVRQARESPEDRPEALTYLALAVAYEDAGDNQLALGVQLLAQHGKFPLGDQPDPDFAWDWYVAKRPSVREASDLPDTVCSHMDSQPIGRPKTFYSVRDAVEAAARAYAEEEKDTPT